MVSASKGMGYWMLRDDGWESLSPCKWLYQYQAYRKIAIIVGLLSFINSTRNSQEISISLVW